MPSGSVDSIVTDPPYGLSFMGKKWDYDVPSVEVWAECLRVLRPGGHLLAFAGTRTQHRMAVRIEDAGFEIRDMIAWVYGSGFPKSLDVSKAIDKAAGAEREIVGVHPDAAKRTSGTVTASGWETPSRCNDITAPATEAAKQWQGWGTALKPALEPITVARKPLIGTVAANVLRHGTGGINVDGCRVGADGGTSRSHQEAYGGGGRMDQGGSQPWRTGHEIVPINAGRWPANLIHDGSDEVLALFPDGAKPKPSRTGLRGSKGFGCFDDAKSAQTQGTWPADEGGSAARFFYCAKASRADRGEGNTHPTVKPTELMRYLVRLVTPKGGIVLDPFMGSGSTGKAAAIEGLGFIGIDRDADYVEVAKTRAR